MKGPIDAELLGRFLDEHGPSLALYAAQWTDAAEDCVQESLVELARQSVVPENVLAWLYRVVKNRALNTARATHRRRERESRAIAARFEDSGVTPGTPANALAVAEALEKLTTIEREIVVMKIWGNLTHEEIAKALEVSVSSSHRYYRQALIRLRQHLELPCSIPSNPKTKNSPRN